MNIYAVFVAAVTTFLIGSIWYHPKVFGNAWMKESGMTHEKAKQANMAKLFGFAFLFSLLIAFIMPTFVIHQIGVLQAAGGNENDLQVIEFLKVHGEKFRDFKHGILHGLFIGIFVALPVLGTNALFEQKSWKYIFINSGYWIVSFALMGGIICAWK